MKYFKQILIESGKRYKGHTPSMKREGDISGNELASTYRGVGHDAYNKGDTWEIPSEKIKDALKTVYGLHGDSKRKPDLWAAGPHIDRNSGENIGNVNIRKSVSDMDDRVHTEVFPELQHGNQIKPFIGGRIDHVRKIISIKRQEPPKTFISRFSRPSKFMSQSSIDSLIRDLKTKHPDYDIADFIEENKIVSFRKFILENSSVPYGRRHG